MMSVPQTLMAVHWYNKWYVLSAQKGGYKRKKGQEIETLNTGLDSGETSLTDGRCGWEEQRYNT